MCPELGVYPALPWLLCQQSVLRSFATAALQTSCLVFCVLLYEAWMCASIILLQRRGIMGSFGLWLIPFTFAASRKSPGSISMHSVWPFFLQGPEIPTKVFRAPLVYTSPILFSVLSFFWLPWKISSGFSLLLPPLFFCV